MIPGPFIVSPPGLILSGAVLLVAAIAGVLLWRRHGPLIPALLAGVLISGTVALLGPLHPTEPGEARSYTCHWQNPDSRQDMLFTVRDTGDHLHGLYEASTTQRKAILAVAEDGGVTFTVPSTKPETPPDLVVMIDSVSDEPRQDAPRPFRALGLLVGDDPLGALEDFSVEGTCQATPE